MVEELYECLVLLFTAFSVLSLFLMLKSMQCISVSIVAVVLLLICVQLFVTPCTITHQTPLSMGFPRQEYWSGLPFPSPGDLPGIFPTQELNPGLLHCRWILYHLSYPNSCDITLFYFVVCYSI